MSGKKYKFESSGRDQVDRSVSFTSPRPQVALAIDPPRSIIAQFASHIKRCHQIDIRSVESTSFHLLNSSGQK
jgi:hypothetical protein